MYLHLETWIVFHEAMRYGDIIRSGNGRGTNKHHTYVRADIKSQVENNPILNIL